MASLSSSESALLGDISKMKVAELKKELKVRGLSTAGTKPELIERLQSANNLPAQDGISEDDPSESQILGEDEDLGDLEGVEAGGDFDDDDVLADEPKEPKDKAQAVAPPLKRPAPLAATEPSQESQPKKRLLVRPPISINTSSGKENGSQENNASMEVDGSKTVSNEANEKKVVKLSGIPAKERLQLRAQKFGTPLSEDAKKLARAERFGLTSPTTVPATATATATTKALAAPDTEMLKKRAERFGAVSSHTLQKVEEEEKKKKRLERFGLTAATAETLDEKKKLRAERFKL